MGVRAENFGFLRRVAQCLGEKKIWEENCDFLGEKFSWENLFSRDRGQTGDRERC